jgi:hypothetical protein
LSVGAGFQGVDFDLSDSTGSGWGGWAEEYQVQSSAGAINPSMQQMSPPGYNWDAMGIALKPGTGGTGPGNFAVLNVYGANTYGSVNATRLSFEFPVRGNLVLLEYDDWNSVTAISDSAGLVWRQIGRTCDSSIFPAGAWYAVNTGPSIAADTITIRLSHTSTVGIGTYFMGFFHDIQGASTSTPIDTGIGTGGLVCATGDRKAWRPNLNYFTFTPTNSNEILLVHANQDNDDAVGVSSPTEARFISPAIVNAGNFNFTFDESAFQSICQNCSGPLEWTGMFNHANGTAENRWVAIGVGVNQQ